MAKRKKHWMKEAFGKHPGKFHRRTYTPMGERVPESKVRKAEHSSDPSLRREAALAETGRKYGGKKHHKRASRRSGRRS